MTFVRLVAYMKIKTITAASSAAKTSQKTIKVRPMIDGKKSKNMATDIPNEDNCPHCGCPRISSFDEYAKEEKTVMRVHVCDHCEKILSEKDITAFIHPSEECD